MINNGIEEVNIFRYWSNLFNNISFVLLMISFPLMERHIAFTNISFIVLLLTNLIENYYSKNFTFSYNWKIVIPFVVVFLCCLLSMIFQDEKLNFIVKESKSLIWFFIYPLTILIFKKKPIELIVIGIITFQITIIIISLISMYNCFVVEPSINPNYVYEGFVDTKYCYFNFAYHKKAVLMINGIVFMFYFLRLDIQKTLKIIIYTLIVISSVIILVLGSRIGILLLIITMLVFILHINSFNIFSKKVLISLITIIIIVFTFRTNIEIRMKESFDQLSKVQKGELRFDNNFGGRAIAFKVGLDILNKNKSFGIKRSSEDSTFLSEFKIYSKNHNIDYIWGEKAPLRPHFQFLRSSVNLGIGLGIIFSICFFIPYFISKSSISIHTLMFMLVNLIYWCVEFPIDAREWFYSYYFMCPLLFYTHSFYKVK